MLHCSGAIWIRKRVRMCDGICMRGGSCGGCRSGRRVVGAYNSCCRANGVAIFVISTQRFQKLETSVPVICSLQVFWYSAE